MTVRQLTLSWATLRWRHAQTMIPTFRWVLLVIIDQLHFGLVRCFHPQYYTLPCLSNRVYLPLLTCGGEPRSILLTPSLPWCHFKTTNNSAKFETSQPFCLLRTGMWKDFHQNAYSTESRCVIGLKIDCLQARPCIFQPRNFTCWGSEGVNAAT